ncbi:MAG: hypothetical protein ACPGUV_00175 [Polyangiales bacterium]
MLDPHEEPLESTLAGRMAVDDTWNADAIADDEPMYAAFVPQAAEVAPAPQPPPLPVRGPSARRVAAHRSSEPESTQRATVRPARVRRTPTHSREMGPWARVRAQMQRRAAGHGPWMIWRAWLTRRPTGLARHAVAVVLGVVLLGGLSLTLAHWRYRHQRDALQTALQAAASSGTQQSADQLLGTLRTALQDFAHPGAKLGRFVATLMPQQRDAQIATQLLHDRHLLQAHLAFWNAVAASEHSPAYAARARRWLRLLPPAARASTVVRLAQAHLQLGRPVTGDKHATPLRAQSPQHVLLAAEWYRVQALRHARHGARDRALAYARSAWGKQRRAVRHAVLFAHLLATKHGKSAALRVLHRLGPIDDSPLLRLARARVLQARDPESAWAVAEADALQQVSAATLSPGQRAWTHLLLARHAASLDNRSQALRHLGHAARMVTHADVDLRRAVAQLLTEQGKGEQAAAVLAGLQTKTTSKPVGRSAAKGEVDALTLVRSHHPAMLQQALAAHGTGATAALIQGRLAWLQGQLSQAQMHYESAVAHKSTAQAATLGLATVHQARGEDAPALRVLQSAPEPSHGPVLAARAAQQWRQGDLQGAARTLQSAPASAQRHPHCQQMRARLALSQGQLDAAAATLAKLMQQAKQDATTWTLRAALLRRRGDRTGAAKALTQALQRDANDVDAVAAMVLLKLEDGQQAAAGQLLAPRHALSRQSLPYAQILADAFLDHGMGRIAADTLMPHVPSASQAAFWSRMGWAMIQAEQQGDARRAFKRALAADAQHVSALHGMALIEGRYGSFGQAQRSLVAMGRALQAQGFDPQANAHYIVAQARLSYERNDLGNAERLAQQALSLHPTLPAAHLVNAVVALERRQPHTEHLRRALQGQAPLPEVMGRLARKLPAGAQRLALFRRYLASAPRGYDASAAQKAVGRAGGSPVAMGAIAAMPLAPM